MKKLLIVNQCFSKNVGDIILNKVLVDLLKDKFEITNMPFIAKCPSNNKFVKQTKDSNVKGDSIITSVKKSLAKLSLFNDYFISKTKKRIIEFVSNNEYDYVLIGGGELVRSKHEFTIDLIAWIEVFKKTKSKIIMFGVSCDRHFEVIESIKLKRALKQVDYTNVRDINSKEYLNTKFDVETSFSPDVAFLYKKMYDNHKYCKSNRLIISLMAYDDIGKQKVYSSRNEYYEYWEKLIIENIDSYKEIKGFANTNGDKVETNLFIDWFSSRNNCVILKCDNIDLLGDYQKVIKEIAEADTMITGRMHAMILGKQYNTKIIPFIFKNKIKDFAETYIFNEIQLDYGAIETNIKTELYNALN